MIAHWNGLDSTSRRTRSLIGRPRPAGCGAAALASASTSTTGRSSAAATRTTSSYSGCAVTTTPSSRDTLTGTSRPPTSTDVVSRGSACRSTRLVRMPMVEVSRKIGPTHLGGVGRADQRAEGVRRPALLHQDRGEPGVQGPGGEHRGDDVGPHPRVEVVDVGLEHQEVVGAVLGAVVAGTGEPTSRRSTLAWPSGSRPPAPTPTADGHHRRLRPPAGGQRGEQRGAGRGAQLHRGGAVRSGVRRHADAAAARPPGAGPAACRGRRGPTPSRPRPG